MKKITFGLLLFVAAFLITGCATEVQEPVDVETAKQTIMLGVSMPLTGAVADQAERFMQGVNIALDEYDSNTYDIQLVIEDDRCSAATSINTANKLVNTDNINKLIVYCGAASPPFVEPVKSKNGIIFIESIKLEIDEGKNPFMFNMLPPASTETKKIAEYLINNGITNVAVVYQQDYFGQTYKNKFVADYTALGGKVEFVEGYDTNANKDFRTAITKFKSSNIRAVVNFMAHPANFDLLLRQSEELGYEPLFMGQWITENPSLLTAAGSLADGIIYTHPVADLKSAEYSVLRTKYVEKYDREPNLDAVNGYDTIKLFTQLVELCGDDATCMVDALNSGEEFNGLTGKISFTNNMKDVPIFLKTISNGEFVLNE